MSTKDSNTKLHKMTEGEQAKAESVSSANLQNAGSASPDSGAQDWDDESYPTYPSYNYPYMEPPYPSPYDVISLGMSTGVGAGGIIGMLVSLWIPTAMGETIAMFSGMAIGTVIGGTIGIVHYFLSKPVSELENLAFDGTSQPCQRC